MEIVSKKHIFGKIGEFWKENKNGVLEIFGPTASGKTKFSLEIAQKYAPAEIISVDSRQIFKDINISSAKITIQEMKKIPHWGIDLVSPNEEYSVFEFQKYAFDKIEEILKRKAHPILCGGTMLWLDAISENYCFGKKGEKSTKKGPPKYPFLKIGIWWARDILYERINKRAEKQFEEGLIEETQDILKKYNLSRSALTSFGYAEIKDHLEKKISKEQAVEKNKKRNRNYAKRQLTWWRGREDILWVNGESL